MVTFTQATQNQKTTMKRNAESEYLAAYARAMKAWENLNPIIHDNPDPKGETQIKWGHVADMLRIAVELEEMSQEK